MASLGKFTLMEELGRGSMGTVYRARDAALDRDVAVKQIRTGAEVEPEMRERFFREARTCARLQHPHIVTVFELYEQENFALIVMELLSGSDFRGLIERKVEISLPAKLSAMVQVCEALGHAHQNGIVHRDIKPSNLFLHASRSAKVLDFGIARLPSSKLTVDGRILGTPNYMAPEQILNQKSDGRADLFSAAVVFFEFLVQHHPFASSTLIPRRIVDDEPDSPYDYDSSIPLAFEAIFARALQKDPDRRYATGDEMAADLRAVLDGNRKNGTSTTSTVTLPSTQASVARAFPNVPILNEAPDSEDPEEWRLSEFLRLIPDFEAAIEQRQASRAGEILELLREIERTDSRFTESIRVCEQKMVEQPKEPVGQQSNYQSSGGTSMGVGRATIWTPDSGIKCRECQSTNRPNAKFCLSCGASMYFPPPIPTPPAPDPRPAPPEPRSRIIWAIDRNSLYALPALGRRTRTRQPAKSPLLWIVAGGVGFCLLLIVGLYLWLQRGR